MFNVFARVLASTAAVAALVCGPGAIAAAQSDPCPVVSTNVVSDALGTSVRASAMAGLPEGLVLCDFKDPSGTNFGVGRESNVFDSGTPVGAAGLASRYVGNLPDEARRQIDELSSIGIKVGTQEIAAVSGVGDSALWVKQELVPNFFFDSLLVQGGSSVYTFNADDSPATQARLTTLARAVLAAQ